MATTFHQALTEAFKSLSRIEGQEWPASLQLDSSLGDTEALSNRLGLNLDQVLAAAALGLAKTRLDLPARQRRNDIRFFSSDLRPSIQLEFVRGAGANWALNPETILRAVLACNLTIEIVHDLSIANNVPLFELLGLRNLSSFIGEMFAKEIRTLMPDHFISNPNQDGYPDLCALTEAGKTYIKLRTERGETSAKEFWSPFPYGGIEVKSTCGNTPAARTVPKPKIGESRYPILVSAEWKAHHRQTNNLVGLYWDFIDGLPTVLAVFFRNDLLENDWGKIIQPKEGGGKTTSVSIMARPGVEKMALGWMVLPDDTEILARLMQPRVFPLHPKNTFAFSSKKKSITRQ